MGRILQIRVSASTFDEKDVEKAWPALNKLVWEKGEFMNPARGVMELAHAAFTAVDAALLPPEQADTLEEGARRAEDIRRRMETALGEWDARTADKLSYELEDALDELEQTAKGL
ncbi:hypothetical protein [Salidesulfovibrio onnuriiensis]|uniref:hypothetical protein n=1 Tax=Salidesulfovibrio onnuriiensis TaxID=2583823 RepID=UPI0011C8AC6B|nr:hypothetical protein [Salidesulfovibrio onnuriiensis]